MPATIFDLNMKRWSSPFQVCFNLTGCKTPAITFSLVRRESKEAENVAFDVFYVFSDSVDCSGTSMAEALQYGWI